MYKISKILAAAALLLASGTAGSIASAQSQNSDGAAQRRNATGIALRQDNIDEILRAMTLREKASLVVGAGLGSEAGMSILSSDPVRVPGAAGMTRSIGRLGIPSLVLADGPAGVRIDPKRRGDHATYYCTAFPTGSLMACTWNTAMVEKVGAAMGNEALEYGVDILLCPAMNIMRNPLCGRNFEYYSEDPLLAGKTAAAMIRGIQSNGVGTSAKHFAANNQETNRTGNNVIIDEQVLRDIYLKAFEIAVKEAQPWTIMSSYNKINGKYTQADEWLLTEVLRGEWGFEGMVVTDWTMPRNIAEQIAAGNDLMEWGMKSQINEIVRKVRNGKLDEAKLDICVRRVLELIVKTPAFRGYEYSSKPDLAAHAQVSREAAAEGMVLLENNGALPLASTARIALYGVASYDMIAGGTGSGNVNKPYVVSIRSGLEEAGYKVDEAIAGTYGEYLSHRSNRKKGYVMTGDPAWKEMAVRTEDIRARVPENDVAVVTICRQAGEAGDRGLEDDFLLSELELALIGDVCREYHAAGKKVAVVLNIGGVIETASWKQLPDAVLLAWGPGQEGGRAVADILSGKVNPSGHLAMTFPIRYSDVPSSANFPSEAKSGFLQMVRTMTNGNKDRGRKDFDYTEYAEGRNVGYRYFGLSGENVSYPFGFGRSYTTFEQTELSCTTYEQAELGCTSFEQAELGCTSFEQMALGCTSFEQTDLGCTSFEQMALGCTSFEQTALGCTSFEQTALGCTSFEQTALEEGSCTNGSSAPGESEGVSVGEGAGEGTGGCNGTSVGGCESGVSVGGCESLSEGVSVGEGTGEGTGGCNGASVGGCESGVSVGGCESEGSVGCIGARKGTSVGGCESLSEGVSVDEGAGEGTGGCNGTSVGGSESLSEGVSVDEGAGEGTGGCNGTSVGVCESGVRRVKVTNTGAMAGKDVVMIFDAKGELVAFAKTRLLAPGESEVLELRY